MRIGFDAIRALQNRTGLGNYARSLLRSVAAADPERQLLLYSSRPPRAEFAVFPAEIGATLRLPAAPAAWFPSVWRTYQLGRCAAADGVDLYHGLTHEIPRDLPGTGIRSLVTVHDLIFEKFPQYFPRIDRASYRWRYRWSARHATGIIAVSAETRDDLIERYQIDPARITVIPPVRDTAFAVRTAPEMQSAVVARYRLPANYLLTIGTLESRKNQRILVEAIARLPRDSIPPLVLIGSDGGAAATIRATAERLGVADRVQIRTDVATSDLPALLQRATLFLYPSRAEGFGLPIVEALSAGVPVIAANGRCLIEAGGPGTRYLPADDVADWAATIDELLADSGARARMINTGLEHATQFDGNRVAAKLLAVYDATIRTGPLP